MCYRDNIISYMYTCTVTRPKLENLGLTFSKFVICETRWRSGVEETMVAEEVNFVYRGYLFKQLMKE